MAASALLHFLLWQQGRELEPEREVPVRIPHMVEVTLIKPPSPKVAPTPQPSAPVTLPKPVEPPKAVETPKPKLPPPPPKPKPLPKPKPIAQPRPVKPVEIPKPDDIAIPVPKSEHGAEAKPAPVTEPRPVAPVVPVRSAPPAASMVSDSYQEAKANAAYLHNPRPEYPALARQRLWEGKVLLKVQVLANGKPGEISLQQGSGHEVLDESALAVVRGWNFVPAKRGGTPVDSWVTVPIVFKLDR